MRLINCVIYLTFAFLFVLPLIMIVNRTEHLALFTNSFPNQIKFYYQLNTSISAGVKTNTFQTRDIKKCASQKWMRNVVMSQLQEKCLFCWLVILYCLVLSCSTVSVSSSAFAFKQTNTHTEILAHPICKIIGARSGYDCTKDSNDHHIAQQYIKVIPKIFYPG